MELEERIINDEQLDSVAGGINGMEIIGYLIVKTYTEFKSDPDLNAETVETGNWGRYRVYEIVSNQGLLWYRTALHKWAPENPQNSFSMLKKSF